MLINNMIHGVVKTMTIIWAQDTFAIPTSNHAIPF
uniref:Uncharacterized protein n=1 Tax=Rhizophora mucronata TaxID=61149 RepID=A0A2P2NWE1_RHIMU